MRAPKNDEFSEGGRGTRGDSLLPPDPQLTIVKIDNKQKNNKTKTKKLTADNLQQITCKEIPAKGVACEGGVHER